MSEAMDAADGPLRARSARGAMWAVLEGGLAQLITFLSFVIIARFVSPSGFGLVALGLAAIEVLRLVLIDPLAIVLTSHRKASSGEWQGAFWISVALGTTLTALGVLAAPSAAALLHEHALAPVLQAIALTLCLHGVGRVPEGWLVREMRFGALAFRAIFSACIGAGAGIAAALAGWGVYALVVQQLAAAFVAVTLALTASKWQWAAPANFTLLRPHLKAALTLSPGALGHVLSQNLDIFALTAAAGATATGLYGLARRIRLAMQLVFAGLGRVALSALGTLDEARRGTALTRAAEMTLLVAGPVFVGLAVVAPDLIAVLFGPEWVASASVLAILALSGPLLILNDFFEQVLILLRKLRELAFVKLGYAAVLGLAIFIAARFSLVSVALVAVACIGLVWPILSMLVAHAMPFSISGYFLAAARAAAPSVTMGVAVSLTRAMLMDWPALERLVVLVAFGAAVFALAVWLFARDAGIGLLTTGREALRNALRRAR
jgi:O-antigen/teichoic acid export membrane protein